MAHRCGHYLLILHGLVIVHLKALITKMIVRICLFTSMLDLSQNTYSYGSLDLHLSNDKYYLLRLNYSEDYDGDNLANEIDDDDDDDTVNDIIDNCRLGLTFVSSTNNDRDNDGCRDTDEDLDDDGDGLNDNLDFCPSGTLYWIRNSTTDNDNDGCNDASEDFDDDNDAYLDYEDMCPRLSGTSNYTRELGCPDSDGDGRANLTDPFPNDATEWKDTDQDGVGDNGDAYPLDATQSNDTDNDGYGDNTNGNSGDQCPLIWGNGQQKTGSDVLIWMETDTQTTEIHSQLIRLNI